MAQFALVELIAEFLSDNPKVDVIQNVTNQKVDLVEARVDIAIRGHAGPLPDASFVQSRLARTPWFLFAAPDYLEHAGYPESPDDLEEHQGLKVGWKPEVGQWTLRGTDEMSVTVQFQPRLCSDDMSTLKQAAAAGLGIVALPGYVCRKDVMDGRLVRVLPDWIAGDAQLSMVMPTRRGRMPAVEALAEHLRRELPRFVDLD